MTKTRKIHFLEMRRLLKYLGYQEKCTEKAHVFFRSRTDMVVFRLYDDQDALRSGDIVSTRHYLDRSGAMSESDFDSFFDSIPRSA